MRLSRSATIIGALMVVIAIAGCQHTATPAPRDAVLIAPDAACRAALASAAASLEGAPVLLADDAFVQSPTVTVERRAALDPSTGRPREGRDTSLPQVLRLVTRDGTCRLMTNVKGPSPTLAGCRCRDYASP